MEAEELVELLKLHDSVYEQASSWFTSLKDNMKSQILSHFGHLPNKDTDPQVGLDRSQHTSASSHCLKWQQDVFELVYSSSCRPVPAVLPGAGGFLLFFRWKIVPSSPSSPWPHSKTASSPSAECSSLSHAKGRGDHPAPRQICDGWTELTGAARVSLDFWYLFIWMIYWLIFTSLHHFHQLLPVCPGFSRHNCLCFFGFFLDKVLIFSSVHPLFRKSPPSSSGCLTKETSTPHWTHDLWTLVCRFGQR